VDARQPNLPALSDCRSNSNANPTGSAVATSTTATGTITATGAGVGAITVGRYASNPVGPPTFNAAGAYFDVRTSDAGSLTAASINDCDLHGAVGLQWWNPGAAGGAGAWQPVTPETSSPGPPACLAVQLSATSSPSLAQLTGTVFAAALPASSAPAFTADSPPVTATAGSEYSYAFVAGGTPTATYSLAGAPSWLTINSASGVVSGVPPAGITSFAYSVLAANGVAPTATAGPFTVSVSPATGKARASVDLQSSANRVRPGERVALYAEVFGQRSKPAPTGTVSFTDNGTPIAGCLSLKLSRTGDVLCQLSFASTAASPHQVIDSYSGDATYASAAGTTTITVSGGHYWAGDASVHRSKAHKAKAHHRTTRR